MLIQRMVHQTLRSCVLRYILFTGVSAYSFVVPSSQSLNGVSAWPAAERCALQTTRGLRMDVSGSSSPKPAQISRRSLALSFVGMLGLAVPTGDPQAWADFPSVSATEEGFVAGANGVKIKDYAPGVGTETKDGDTLRIQIALYLPDGTIVSRFAGVEAKVTLGKQPQPFPPGLVDNIKGMKVGAERAIVIPPELGWTEKYRAIAVPYLRGCAGGACPLDDSPVIAQVKLMGFKKAECAEGDAPVSADLSKLNEGKIMITIGSSTCPEGDVEVTEERLRAKRMIDRLKQAGKL